MKVIVCGAGNVALRVFELLKKMGETVTVISLDDDGQFTRQIRAQCDFYIKGDARDAEVLSQAGIDRADALIALTGDEVLNLEISIRARDLNSKIRLVARMFDDNLFSRIESGFGIDRVLGVPVLASPSFVAACMGDSIQHSFTFEGAVHYIVECTVEKGSPLDGMDIHAAESKFTFKNLIVIHEEVEAGKGTDALCAGDIILFSTQDKNIMDRIGRVATPENIQHMKASPPRRKLMDRFRAIPYNIRLIAGLYMLLIFIAVAVFRVWNNLSLIDAFYFTITTTTSVGYGDINLQNATPLIKIFGCLVMIGGTALLAAIFSVITDLLISRRFNQFFGIGKSRMKNHIVVAGIGNIGYRVINLLAEAGEKVIAIEKNLDCVFLTSLRGRIPVIFGNAINADTMKLAGIKNAKAVLALTDDDLANINVILNAYSQNDGLLAVGRIFNTGIREKAAVAFRINKALSASAITAPTFVAAAACPGTEYAFPWRDTLLVIIKVETASHPFLVNRTEKEITDEYNLHPCVYRHGEGSAPVCDIDYHIQTEDTLLLVGKYEDIKRFPWRR